VKDSGTRWKSHSARGRGRLLRSGVGMRFRPVRSFGLIPLLAALGCSDDAGKSPFVADAGGDDAPDDVEAAVSEAASGDA